VKIMGRALAAFVVATAPAACVPGYPAADAELDAAPRDAAPPEATPAEAAPPDSRAAPDAASAVEASDAEAGAPPKTIACHTDGVDALCPVGAEACCGVFANKPDFCVPLPDDAGACASPDAAVALIECDEPSDCAAGTVCCAFDVDLATGNYSAIRCVPPETCVAPHAVECGLKENKSDSACPPGKLCTFNSPDRYYDFCH
jgi:hypothetical protein